MVHNFLVGMIVCITENNKVTQFTLLTFARHWTSDREVEETIWETEENRTSESQRTTPGTEVRLARSKDTRRD